MGSLLGGSGGGGLGGLGGLLDPLGIFGGKGLFGGNKTPEQGGSAMGMAMPPQMPPGGLPPPGGGVSQPLQTGAGVSFDPSRLSGSPRPGKP